MNLTKLYPYQAANSEVLAGRQSGADLSEVGTGKTITALATMARTGARVMLIVAPKSVSSTWEVKFGEFWPEVQVFRPRKSERKSRVEAYKGFVAAYRANTGPIALVVTYEQVRMDIAILERLKFDVVYADEIHRIGNPLTETAKRMARLSSHRRYGATATPMRSSPLQAFGIFNWLAPGSLGKNYYSFQARYVVKNKLGWVEGYHNLEELGMRIRPLYVATTMETAGVYMPELVEEDVIFELNAKEDKLYTEIKKQMLLEIDEILINKIENPSSLQNSVVNLGKLQELTDSMELIGEGTESSKLKMLQEHLSDTLVNGNKAVIFTRFARMANILARELKEYNPAVITGATKDRLAEIQRLDNDPECKLIIVTTAGNEGINLQRANLLYMYDVPLGSYGSLVQTIGRIKRIGQTKNMVVYYLMAERTVDVKLRNLLLKKKDMSERIFSNLSELREVLV